MCSLMMQLWSFTWRQNGNGGLPASSLCRLLSAGSIVWEGNNYELRVGNDCRPLLFPRVRFSGLPGNANEEVIQKVGAASKAQHGVGQLQGEMS